jgi:beta-fructofuranosidase
LTFIRQYTNTLPTAPAGFRSTMGLPRQVGLAHTSRSPWTLIAAPYPIPSSLFQSTNNSNSTIVSSSSTSTPLTNTTSYINTGLQKLASGAFIVNINAKNLDTTTTGTINFTLLASSTGEALRGGFIFGGDGTGTVWLDRSAITGFTSPLFTGQFSNAYVLNPSVGTFEMTVVVDRAIVEVFLDGGVGPSGTAEFFPSENAAAVGGLDVLVLASRLDGGGEVSGQFRGLDSSWNYTGNHTSAMGRK